jgi:hypothetical protein
MSVLITHASAIANLHSLVTDDKTWAEIKLKTPYGYIDVGWFKDHHTHELIPRNEYGHFDE